MPGGMNGIIDGMTIGVEFRHNQCLLLCLRGAPHPVIPDGFNDVGAHQGQLFWRQCLFAGNGSVLHLVLLLFRRTDFHDRVIGHPSPRLTRDLLWGDVIHLAQGYLHLTGDDAFNRRAQRRSLADNLLHHHRIDGAPLLHQAEWQTG